MHNAADDPAIVRSLDAPDIRRQVRFDPLPLLIAQPKQVPAHDPNPLPKTNQDRIVRAEKLMSSDPSTPLLLNSSGDLCRWIVLFLLGLFSLVQYRPGFY